MTGINTIIHTKVGEKDKSLLAACHWVGTPVRSPAYGSQAT